MDGNRPLEAGSIDEPAGMENTVLAVDDNPANLDLLKKILEKGGYRFRGAINGRLALRTIQEMPPDLILMDVMMPELNGYEVCELLQGDDRHATIPVIFVSARDALPDKVRAYHLGGVDYITKPFYAEEVLARVKVHVSLKNMRTRLERQNQELERRVRERTRDLNAAKEMAEAARMSAETANKAKSEFLAVISHEIRTPLNAILGMTEVIRDSGLDEEQSRCMKILDNAGNNMLSLVEDILDLAQIESGRLSLVQQTVDLNRLIKKVMAFHNPNAEKKGLEFRQHLDPGVPDRFPGDPKRMRQVLINLLGNAVKFTDRGRVELRVSRPRADLLLFSVADTGIGIAADKQTMIFEPFSQADASSTRKHGGTGVGLAICKRLIEAMNGSIHLESQPGKGSIFHVSIPLTGEPPPKSATATTAAVGGKSTEIPGGRSILLAEDVPDNARIIEAFLKNSPHRLEIVENGDQAVAKIRAGEKYDLLLMDIQMPGMDGLQATRQIRDWEKARGRERTAIVALSAHARVEDMEKSLAADCDGHINKPISKGRLLEVIDQFAKWSASWKMTPPGPAPGDSRDQRSDQPVNDGVDQ